MNVACCNKSDCIPGVPQVPVTFGPKVTGTFKAKVTGTRASKVTGTRASKKKEQHFTVPS